MAIPTFREGDITFEEFVDLVPDGQKADLLDGVIYLASPDSIENNDLNSWLCAILAGFVGHFRLGKVYVSRVAYRIGGKRGLEPDLSFLPKKMEVRRRRGYVEGPPALAIEIVSPDSVSRDYVKKRQVYEEAGVEEYWILDPAEMRATFLCLEKGRFKKCTPNKHIWRSRVLPGLNLDVRWFWDENRPEVFEVLERLFEKT
jgi:Uma2 family endonuclease